MSDYFEIDFLDVETAKSGDAIPLRYEINGNTYIHVVDGGFQDTGAKIIEHMNAFYGKPKFVHHVVVTHPDGDHACGLQTVLKEVDVGQLWMLRPWLYAEELIPRFSRFTSVDNLKKRLREIYPFIAELEEIALERGITISEPFQGASIGAFTVLAPTKQRYLDLVVSSEKTPEAVAEAAKASGGLMTFLEKAATAVVSLIRAAWGEETFSTEETAAENDMSVVQYAYLCGERIVLTGDAGRTALNEAADCAIACGVALPGVGRFQVPHHGSRRNVSTEVLDRWLGTRLSSKPAAGQETFSAIISAAKKDESHPRKAVVRAMIHRGARVVSTQTGNIQVRCNAPDRGWGDAAPMPYPEEQED